MALTALRRKMPDDGGGISAMGMPHPMDAGHHPGLCISLNDEVLSQLDVDDDVEVGDMLHLRVMVEVTSVHKDGGGCRIEAAITHGTVENEDDEEGDEAE
jgi:hypothetical protein